MTGRHLTEAQRARVLELRADGLPASWIAEDIGAAVGTVQRLCPSPPGEAAAWRSASQQIRRDPALFALHAEISPRGRRA